MKAIFNLMFVLLAVCSCIACKRTDSDTVVVDAAHIELTDMNGQKPKPRGNGVNDSVLHAILSLQNRCLEVDSFTSKTISGEYNSVLLSSSQVQRILPDELLGGDSIC